MRVIMSALTALCFLVATPAFAEKPDWAGKGKPAKEHLKAMDSKTDDEVEAMKERGKVESEKRGKKARDLGKKAEEELEEAQKKMKGAGHEMETMEKRGLEKQREKKAEQVQKELDKGSEKGQEARQKRKKWWKFWQ